MLNIALFIQKVLHLLKYWEKTGEVYVCNEEDTSSLCRDSEVVLHWARGHPQRVDSRLAGLQHTQVSCTALPSTALPPNKPFSLQSPGGWRSETPKQTLTLVPLLAKSDTFTGSLLHDRSNPHASTPPSVRGREDSINSVSQTWHAFGVHKEFYLHMLEGGIAQEAANPDRPLVSW